MGFDKLIDLIIGQINDIIPFKFVYQYFNGAKYKGGKFVKICTPGIWWKTPWLEKIFVENIKDTSILLPTQTIPCIDFELVIRGCIGYCINDVAMYFNNVYDTKSVISDNSCRIIRHVISTLTYEEIKQSIILVEDKESIDLEESLKSLIQKELNNYGIKVNFISLIEISKARSYKLWNESVRLES